MIYTLYINAYFTSVTSIYVQKVVIKTTSILTEMLIWILGRVDSITLVKAL